MLGGKKNARWDLKRDLWSLAGFHNLMEMRTWLSADGNSPLVKERQKTVRAREMMRLGEWPVVWGFWDRGREPEHTWVYWDLKGEGKEVGKDRGRFLHGDEKVREFLLITHIFAKRNWILQSFMLTQCIGWSHTASFNIRTHTQHTQNPKKEDRRGNDEFMRN